MYLLFLFVVFFDLQSCLYEEKEEEDKWDAIKTINLASINLFPEKWDGRESVCLLY